MRSWGSSPAPNCEPWSLRSCARIVSSWQIPGVGMRLRLPTAPGIPGPWQVAAGRYPTSCPLS
jgi:hypothetical protein